MNYINYSEATLCTINGEIADHLPLSDRSAAYGHGLFETMLFSGGKVVLWPRHMRRLINDARVLGIPVAESTLQGILRGFCERLASQSVDAGTIKMIVTAGSGWRGYQSPALPNARIICQHFVPQPRNMHAETSGLVLTECVYRMPENPVLAGIKHLNRLDQIIARAEWADEYDDGLMYSANEHVIETTRANIFMKIQDKWLTPALDQSGVSGVMRGLLIEHLFPHCKLPVAIQTIERSELSRISEIFCCNALRGITPVIKIAGIGGWAVGEDTKRLQKALSELYDGYPC